MNSLNITLVISFMIGIFYLVISGEFCLDNIPHKFFLYFTDIVKNVPNHFEIESQLQAIFYY